MSGAAENGSKKPLILKNQEGKSLSVRLRQYRPGDESGMIACIRDEYGNTYFKRNFYLPEQIKKESDCGHITFLVAEEKQEKQRRNPAVSDMEWKQDTFQCSLEIRISRVGQDLPKRMAELHSRYPLAGMQTANVFLNINDRNALWAYRRLTELGYFFTGLKPLCSDREYMVLHNAGEVEMWLEDYVVTEEFKKLVNYIKK